MNILKVHKDFHVDVLKYVRIFMWIFQKVHKDFHVGVLQIHEDFHVGVLQVHKDFHVMF